MHQFIGILGLAVFLGIAWLLSTNKRAINLRIVIGGLILQILFALIILRTHAGLNFFAFARDGVNALISMSDAGAIFLFGEGFQEHFFAFKVLPTIIFVSSLAYVLFYWGILQRVVAAMAWVMVRVMGISGAESLCAAANVFCGQTEAPLLVKPYLKTMTSSEIMCMMTGGMATVAGGVLAAYVGMGISAGHLLSASLMSAPAAILIAKIMHPETTTSPTMGQVKVQLEITEQNVFEAACRGAADGLKLALNVGAMLIAFIALVSLANALLGWMTAGFAQGPIQLEDIFGYIFRPLAFVMGIPWAEAKTIGALLGEKMVINEFVAYMNLGELIKNNQVSERAAAITTYALCGFANFSSIAIQIGGIGSLAPERRGDFAKSGLRAMIGGTLAAFMTAAIAGMLL